jgi:hypothetical protein
MNVEEDGPWQRLYFSPAPQGHGWLRPTDVIESGRSACCSWQAAVPQRTAAFLFVGGEGGEVALKYLALFLSL